MGKFLGFVLLFLIVLLINPLIIYCLWDDVMVKFFNTPDVTFWDSVWISILAAVLFKGNTSSSSN